MGIETFNDGKSTVLGPCPGCTIWTLEYPHIIVTTDWWHYSDFAEDVETILREHVAECAGLQEILAKL
jgi:hypothetical protein